ncbi:type II secretion system protein M, partial [Photobacterium damselae subsp. damselae]|nr:type II secretion system protein M [Photobacterium damselae subsp. damselae]
MIQWQQLDQKFAALSLREKWLITGCGFVAIFFVGIFTFIQPLMADADSAHLSTLDVKNQVITANNQ